MTNVAAATRPTTLSLLPSAAHTYFFELNEKSRKTYYRCAPCSHQRPDRPARRDRLPTRDTIFSYCSKTHTEIHLGKTRARCRRLTDRLEYKAHRRFNEQLVLYLQTKARLMMDTHGKKIRSRRDETTSLNRQQWWMKASEFHISAPNGLCD